MAKKLGPDFMLWVDSATPGTFNLIGGQGDLTISRAAGKMDTSSKDDDGYNTSAPGNKDLGLTLDIIPKLPDANGYTRLETLCAATPQEPFTVQVRKGGKTGTEDDVVFECSVYGNLDETTFPKAGAVGVRASFYPAASPTVDTLA